MKNFPKHGFIVAKKINNKYYYGYINYLGKKILDVKFSEIIRIQDNSLKDDIYLVVANNGKVGFYKNKKEIIKLEYEDIQYDKLNEKLILQKNQKQGISDLNGKIIIPIEYDNIIIAGNCINTQKNREVYLFKPDGTQILNKDFISIFKTENEKFFICVNSEDKYGVLDDKLNKLIENKYTSIQYLWDDFFIIKDGNNYGIIDSSSKNIIGFEYELLQKIENMEIIEGIKNNEFFYLDKEFKQISKFLNVKKTKVNDFLKLYSVKDKKIMYLDKLGNIVDCKDVYNKNKLFSKEKNGKWGFVDKNDRFIKDEEYDYVTEFNEYGFAGIMQDGKWGVINENGDIVCTPKYKFENDYLPEFIGKYFEVYIGYGEKFFMCEN